MALPRLPRRINFSPLRYPGGKLGLSQTLVDTLSANQVVNATYVEPFAGGAGVALYLLLQEHVRSVMINDLDRALFAFWNAVINEPELLITNILNCELTIENWRQQFRIFRSPDPDPFQLAFATLFLNRTNRSGILTGGPIGGMAQTGPWTLDARFNRQSLANRIRLISRYSSRISVTNMDGADLVRELYGDKRCFFYLDPPYVEKGRTLYLNAYRPEDHASLAATLNSLPDTNWVLSYDDNPLVRQLYADRRSKLAVQVPYQAHSRRFGREIVIFSDSLVVPNSVRMSVASG